MLAKPTTVRNIAPLDGPVSFALFSQITGASASFSEVLQAINFFLLSPPCQIAADVATSRVERWGRP
jgi:hypothetical protein